jgi:hypothetical protein
MNVEACGLVLNTINNQQDEDLFGSSKPSRTGNRNPPSANGTGNLSDFFSGGASSAPRQAPPQTKPKEEVIQLITKDLIRTIKYQLESQSFIFSRVL